MEMKTKDNYGFKGDEYDADDQAEFFKMRKER